MRLVNPAEILERYNWYVDVMENEPDSALAKALNEATDYNDRPTDSVAITLTREEWDTVLGWLEFGTDYHMAKRAEWLAVCNDPKLGAKYAAEHEKAAAEAETLRKIIEAAILEDSTNGTTES